MTGKPAVIQDDEQELDEAGNPAQPADNQDQPKGDSGAPAAAPPSEKLAHDDQDMADWRKATADAADEIAAASQAGDAAPPEADQAALPGGGGQDQPAGKDGKPQKDGQQEPGGQETIMVPKARFDKVNRTAHELARRLERTEGERDALKDLANGKGQGAQASQPAAAPEQTPEQRIAALRAEQKGLAKKFGEGEIDADEWEDQRQALDDQIWSIRESGLKAQPAQGKTGSDLYLDEKTAEIEANHPVLQTLTSEDLYYPTKYAMVWMEQNGTPYTKGDPRSILQLREVTASFCDQFYGQKASQTPGAQTPQTPAAPANGKGNGQQPQIAVTPEQRAAKLALAARHPPNLMQSPGTKQGGEAGLTPEHFANMSEDEIAALPQEVRDRIEQQGL